MPKKNLKYRPIIEKKIGSLYRRPIVEKKIGIGRYCRLSVNACLFRIKMEYKEGITKLLWQRVIMILNVLKVKYIRG